ncbi:MAG: pilus assembly protein [Rhodobacteraceae bacterium]|nr:pilus assembly protein [Paracoccaceae bacterium]
MRNEDGAATIEAVLWLPFFILLFGVLVDVSMIFNGQSRLLRIVQDANRNMSIGRLTTTSDTEDFVLARVASIARNPQVSTTYIAGTGLISTTLTVPISDLDIFGAATVFNGVNMVVSAEHLMEN